MISLRWGGTAKQVSGRGDVASQVRRFHLWKRRRRLEGEVPSELFISSRDDGFLVAEICELMYHEAAYMLNKNKPRVMQARSPDARHAKTAAAGAGEVCPGCRQRVPDLRRHMKRCCPEKLPERSVDDLEARRATRKAASEEDWISEEEVRDAALKSFGAVQDPLLRRSLELRFGADRGGVRRTPAEVADELGGKYRGKPEAAASGSEKQLITALLDALASGHDKAASLLFDWGVAPGLGAVAADAPQPGNVHVLILGWGGSSQAQLQPAQKWWQGKGYPTLATTFCPKELEKQIDAISAFLPSKCDVLVHVFSNNGVYLLQELLQQTRESRPWRLSGIILDSAPDACVSPMLMNMVVNGCIRALCKVHGVFIRERAEAALTAFNVIGPLRVGDRIQDQRPIPSVVDPSGSARGYLANTDRGDAMSAEVMRTVVADYAGKALETKDVEALRKFQVSKVEIGTISDFLLQEDVPVMFLYSSTDSLIKAAAVEDFMKRSTREGQMSSKKFAGSQHVCHFQKHAEPPLRNSGLHRLLMQAALNLVRTALRSIPLVADDPKDLVVIYEDASLLAVSKPPCLRCTPVHRFVGKSLTSQILGYFQSRGEGQQTSAPMMLHRLDQTTSGIVLCAKTKAAAKACAEQWHEDDCKKEYLAIALADDECSLHHVGATTVGRPVGIRLVPRSGYLRPLSLLRRAPPQPSNLRRVEGRPLCGTATLALAITALARGQQRRFRAALRAVDIESLEVVDVLCEEEGPVQIRMRWPKGGESRMFNRPRDQLLDKTLMRMSLTLQKGSNTKAKRRGWRQRKQHKEVEQKKVEPPKTITMSLLTNDGQPLDGSLQLEEAFAAETKAAILLAGEESYRVRINRPMARHVTCRGRPRAGLRLAAVAQGCFCDSQKLRWEWLVGGELVSREHCYTPTEAQVGQALEVIARPPLAADPKTSLLLGVDDLEASAQLELPAVQPQAALPGQCDTRSQAMDAQLQTWLESQDKAPNTLRVVSYNALADCYRHCWDQMFPYCQPETLRPEQRLQLIRQEVSTFRADLLGMQEVDATWYKPAVAMHAEKLSRQRSNSFDDEQDGEWWPPPLTEQDVALRQRAKRLLEAIRRIPLVYYDIKAWENEHEKVFSLFRKGCLDADKSDMLEAPIYNNPQIEDAWLFLLEMRRRHFNRRKHVQECARILGASYNWSIVLLGSKKVLEALKDLPQEVCTEILEDANALDLLNTLYPSRRRSKPRQADWLAGSTPSNSLSNAWSGDSDSFFGKDSTSGKVEDSPTWVQDTWPEVKANGRNPKNPFKQTDVSLEWIEEQPQQAQAAPGPPDAFGGPQVEQAELNLPKAFVEFSLSPCVEEYWQPQFAADGFGSCFTKKVSDSLEGCLLVYKEEALELLEIRERPLRDLFRRRVSPPESALEEVTSLPSMDAAIGALVGKLPALDDVFPRLGTVAQLALFRSRKDSSQLLLVCNTHLYFANYARHIRVLQAALLLAEAESMAVSAVEKFGHRPGLLFMGDLNSTPDTAVVELLRRGFVSAGHPDWATCAAFRWGYASSRQAAKDMLAALRSDDRASAFRDLVVDDEGLEALMSLRATTERLMRMQRVSQEYRDSPSFRHLCRSEDWRL
eukprot:s694_g23.t2